MLLEWSSACDKEWNFFSVKQMKQVLLGVVNEALALVRYAMLPACPCLRTYSVIRKMLQKWNMNQNLVHSGFSLPY